jgi:hypothetical protein
MAPTRATRAEEPRQTLPYLAALLGLAVLAGLAWLLARRSSAPVRDLASLSDAQRAELLGQVRGWLDQDATAPGPSTLRGR